MCVCSDSEGDGGVFLCSVWAFVCMCMHVCGCFNSPNAIKFTGRHIVEGFLVKFFVECTANSGNKYLLMLTVQMYIVHCIFALQLLIREKCCNVWKKRKPRVFDKLGKVETISHSHVGFVNKKLLHSHRSTVNIAG